MAGQNASGHKPALLQAASMSLATGGAAVGRVEGNGRVVHGEDDGPLEPARSALEPRELTPRKAS